MGKSKRVVKDKEIKIKGFETKEKLVCERCGRDIPLFNIKEDLTEEYGYLCYRCSVETSYLPDKDE
jgi:hypothetical protein